MKYSTVLLCTCTCLLSSAYAAAPGDAIRYCTSRYEDPGIPDSRILMDSYNYVNLLPPHDGAVWRAVDQDDNNVPGRGTEVINQGHKESWGAQEGGIIFEVRPPSIISILLPLNQLQRN